MLGFFFAKRKTKWFLILITLAILLSSSGVIISKEETYSVSYVEPIATERVLEPTDTSTLELEEIEVVTQSPALEEHNQEIVVPTEKVEPNLEGLYKEIIFSEELPNWYRKFFKPVQVKECSNCSTEEIQNLLEPYEDWIIVQNGRIIYVHSGWPIGKNPAFGQMFVLILREGGDLKGVTFCLDEKCFKILDWHILERDEVGESIPVTQIFDEIDEDDFYLVTCSTGMIPGLKTPKLILRLQLIP